MKKEEKRWETKKRKYRTEEDKGRKKTHINK